jgi:multidrug efflux pump subunit AcrA (membrane-fusion protein)
VNITREFLQLKLQELYLVHEHRVKLQEEREEQQRIREQMREEEKAQRELEQAQEEAAKEEVVAERALEKARLAFERATKGQIEATEQTKAQNAALAAQVAKLENELKEAIDRKAKAIARAQLTKSGHVYILSNIGSFGEDVYKLGLTRRLEPLERVKELGDASVPFEFDVHAMIYSENAPELERKLHSHFSDRRVNMVNLRREYFRVTLEEIIEAVSLYFGVVTFVKIPEAAEYRQTLAKLRDEQKNIPTILDPSGRRIALIGPKNLTTGTSNNAVEVGTFPEEAVTSVAAHP